MNTNNIDYIQLPEILDTKKFIKNLSRLNNREFPSPYDLSSFTATPQSLSFRTTITLLFIRPINDVFNLGFFDRFIFDC